MRRGGVGPVVGGSALLLVALGVAAWGISTRAKALSVVTKETRELAVPTVSVTRPDKGAPQQEIVLPGTMQAFADAPIFARTNGYLRKWYADIGTRVHAGQVLAEIDTPEIDQQLAASRADLATADANLRLAKTTADRYRDLIKSNSVAQQDLDNANGNLEARQTAVASSQANVKRLEQLHDFGRITSPFDGVITARNTDVGALIDSGGNAKELFHVASVNRLRVFVSVPEIYSRSTHPCMEADLTLSEYPGRRFTGKLARTAESIDVATRSLLAEFDVDNPKGELLPGSYAQVHIKLPTQTTSFKLPVNALIFRGQGLQVATVADGSRVELTSVVAGRDFGTSVEIVSGLTGNEQVILNPPDSIQAGETVRVAPAKPTPSQK